MSKFKREFKNVVYNYTDAEAKVREATSNDPWGPSSPLMAELAEYTFHVEAYGLVMGMLWKRLNDHGRNWRHVYKSLVVLDYLVKSGNERVSTQCKENLFSIQTLKDFQFIDKDGKDQGANVREKAKALVTLLKDDDKLKDERKRAKQDRQEQTVISSSQKSAKPKNKVKFADGSESADGDSTAGVRVEQNVEQARPGGPNEEELQLKLALQLSKQQADEEEKLKTQEEDSLRAAIELSKHEASSSDPNDQSVEPTEEQVPDDNLLLDFSSTGLGDPWVQAPEEAPPSYDTLAQDDPFASVVAPNGSTSVFDPFGTNSSNTTANSNSLIPPQQTIASGDPWDANSFSVFSTIPDFKQDPTTPEFSTIPGSEQTPTSSFNPFDLSTLNSDLALPLTTTDDQPSQDKIEHKFLGAEFGNLVDLDSLTIPPPILNNPFGVSTTVMSDKPVNPFDANKTSGPTLNQIAVSSNNPGYSAYELLPPPLIPSGGGSPSGGSPILPRQVPPTHSLPPSSSTDQPFNPFS